jgi:hypothetical protein
MPVAKAYFGANLNSVINPYTNPNFVPSESNPLVSLLSHASVGDALIPNVFLGYFLARWL